jgi:hypothetical protein
VRKVIENNIYKIFLLQLIFLAGVSALTGYSSPPVADINWEIALFLTPLGIIKNLFISPGSITDFYFDVSRGHSLSFGAFSFDYLILFFQSASLEFPIWYLFFKSFKPNRGWKKLFALAISLNAITHPIVFFGLMSLPLTYLQNILLAEAFAVLAEAGLVIYLFKSPVGKSLFVSFLANLISWQLGPMITYVL